MKLNLANNWIAKILSLLLAIAIWFLIKNHLETREFSPEDTTIRTAVPPKATIVPEKQAAEDAKNLKSR